MHIQLSAQGHNASGRQARSQQTVVERRACDILVLGDSAVAYGSSMSLARRGKKVIHLRNMGLVTPEPQKPVEALKPLLLLDTNPLLASMANEAARFFDGLELQAGVPLVVRSKSVDMAVTKNSTRGTQVSTSLMASLMSQLVDVGKQSGVKVKSITSPSDIPLLRTLDNTTAVIQAHGGVINAVAVTGALKTLAKRGGVIQRDELILRGWQDTGSCLRVRASSRLQPDAVSVFEAERVLIAPGAWASDSFRMWQLDLHLKLRARPSLRCSSSPDLSALPLVRYWQPATTHIQQPGSRPGGQHQQVNHPKAPQTAESGSKSEQNASGSTPAISHWVLFPRSGASGTCKLTGLSPSDLQLNSCWELQPPVGMHVPGSPVDGEGRRVGVPRLGDKEVVMEKEWRQAEGLVRGLGRPLGWRGEGEDDEEERGEEGEEEQAKARELATQVAWDVASPDGLPVLGWHPGFESGRVLVACTAGSLPDAAASLPVPVPAQPSAGSESEGQRVAHQAAQARWGQQDGRQAQKGQMEGQRSSSGASTHAKMQGDGYQVAVSAGGMHDGWHVSPLLAKAAADMLLGAAVVDLPVDAAILEPSRPALWTPGGGAPGEGTLDTWDALEDVQTGKSYWREVRVGMNEDELQSEEEETFAHARGVKK